MNPWYDVDDVAGLLKVTPRTVQRWCRERRVPHVRIGRGIRFTAEQLAEIESMYQVGTQVRVDVSARNPAFADRIVVVPVDAQLVRQRRAS
ncbi:MAG: Helix-turn-helix domain [Thermoleophilia bacterium]|nr:Helix-turn-helix domain [Thermoleophilia bacterium]